ncbi:MAG: DUF4266 domain-containing protein [Myxococcota bacterium]
MSLRFILGLLLALAGGCVVVQPYQREHLADPTMQRSDDPLAGQAERKLHVSREGAGGGDGGSAGGGCACGN